MRLRIIAILALVMVTCLPRSVTAQSILSLPPYDPATLPPAYLARLVNDFGMTSNDWICATVNFGAWQQDPTGTMARVKALLAANPARHKILVANQYIGGNCNWHDHTVWTAWWYNFIQALCTQLDFEWLQPVNEPVQQQQFLANAAGTVTSSWPDDVNNPADGNKLKSFCGFLVELNRTAAGLARANGKKIAIGGWQYFPVSLEARTCAGLQAPNEYDGVAFHIYVWNSQAGDRPLQPGWAARLFESRAWWGDKPFLVNEFGPVAGVATVPEILAAVPALAQAGVITLQFHCAANPVDDAVDAPNIVAHWGGYDVSNVTMRATAAAWRDACRVVERMTMTNPPVINITVTNLVQAAPKIPTNFVGAFSGSKTGTGTMKGTLQ